VDKLIGGFVAACGCLNSSIFAPILDVFLPDIRDDQSSQFSLIKEASWSVRKIRHGLKNRHLLFWNSPAFQKLILSAWAETMIVIFGFYGNVFTKKYGLFSRHLQSCGRDAFRLIADKNNACARTPQIMLQWCRSFGIGHSARGTNNCWTFHSLIAWTPRLSKKTEVAANPRSSPFFKSSVFPSQDWTVTPEYFCSLIASGLSRITGMSLGSLPSRESRYSE